MDHSSRAVTLGSLTCEEGVNRSTQDLGFIYVSSEERLIVNLNILHNRRTPLQAEEPLGPIYIPRVSRGVDQFQSTSASRAEKPGGYFTRGTNLWEGVVQIKETLKK